MSRVIIAPSARGDLADLIASLDLPSDTWERVQRSLRMPEQFPHAGRKLGGAWRERRVISGPWPWMVIVYAFDAAADQVDVVLIQDGRNSTAARAI